MQHVRIASRAAAFVFLSAVVVAAPQAAFGAEVQRGALLTASPLKAVPAFESDRAGMTRVELDGDAYAELRGFGHGAVRMSDFKLSATESVDLSLESFDVFSPDARIVVGTANGDVEVGRPDIVLLRGTVTGDEKSSVYLAVSPHGTNGWVRTSTASYLVSTAGPNTGESGTVIYSESSPAGTSVVMRPWTCGAEGLNQQRRPVNGTDKLEGVGGVNAQFAAGAACRVAQIAVDTDWEYTGSLFGGNTNASTAYVATIFGGLTDIYLRDVNTSMEVSFVRVWSDSNDPWNQNDASNQLNQFRSHWNSNMGSVSRNAAHFLSGRALANAGGVAYVDALCDTPWAYGLSAHLNGFFPYPLVDQSNQNWDIVVTAHELGHNFGAPHTHNMNPPIDQCAFGDCSVTPNGTLMSYCHSCPGGLLNTLLRFHDRIIDEQILPYLDFFAPCNMEVACGSVQSPTVEASGCRYVSATPMPPESNQAVALRVTSPTYPCLTKYASASGELVDSPSFLTPATWGTVHMHGEDLVPGAIYTVQSEEVSGATTPGAVAATFAWGDVNDNGIANIEDVQLQVLVFQGDFSLASPEAGDTWPCSPNGVTNIDDVFQSVSAFQGVSFEDAGCGVPCQ